MSDDEGFVRGVEPRVANAPYRCGAQLDAAAFAQVRSQLTLDHCKWDPQVGDAATLADFPLIMPHATWCTLARWAESLSQEAMNAEQELLERRELLAELGLPRRLHAALRSRRQRAAARATPRAYRYDFHYTTDGWRISECNADVPGGYAEASAFPELMAPHYPGTTLAGDPGGAWAAAIARTAAGQDVALLSAPGFMEDHQVIRYLAQRLRRLGVVARCLQPAQIEWRGETASALGGRLGALVRFYQLEWLAASRRGESQYFRDEGTPVLNGCGCVVVESKRFPLTWEALSTRLPTWRRLLPRSADPRHAPWQSDEGWLLKTAFCNTGDTVTARGLSSERAWARARRSVRWFPGNWVAQQRFRPAALVTPLGPRFPCIGVYTIEGRAAGAYVRLSRGPIVDFAAMDAPLLIEDAIDVAHP